jgi:hemerythrin superfamily protein
MARLGHRETCTPPDVVHSSRGTALAVYGNKEAAHAVSVRKAVPQSNSLRKESSMEKMPADAIEMLKADHQKVTELFSEYGATSDQKAKQKIAEQVFVELELHAQLEETVFYPAFEEEADEEGKQLVAESLEEHQTVKDLIEELRELKTNDTEFDTKFHALMENVQHHVEEEESEMFPQAEEVLEAHLEELMDEMQELKQQLTAANKR